MDVAREDGFVSAAGHRLEYGCWRPQPEWRADGIERKRPDIVLLHEGLGSLALWRDFPTLLARHTGCAVLAYSRYGYGRSDPLQQARTVRFMHEEAEHALPELLAALAIECPVLVGHSDGASIALIHAAMHPEQTRAVVALAPHLFVEDITVESIAAIAARFGQSDLPQRMGRYHTDAERTFRGWADIWLEPAFRSWNIETEVECIRCPVLAIQGEDDEYGTLRQVERIAELHADTRVLTLPDCRHSPHLDKQASVLAHIREFTERVAAAMSAGSEFD